MKKLVRLGIRAALNAAYHVQSTNPGVLIASFFIGAAVIYTAGFVTWKVITRPAMVVVSAPNQQTEQNSPANQIIQVLGEEIEATSSALEATDSAKQSTPSAQFATATPSAVQVSNNSNSVLGTAKKVIQNIIENIIPTRAIALAAGTLKFNENLFVSLTNLDFADLIISVHYADGKEVPAQFKQVVGGFEVVKPVSFKPGRYTLKIKDKFGNNYSQDFSWGVLAINTNKSIYNPGETAKIQISVLDDRAKMVCDGQIKLEIRSPSMQTAILSTENGQIRINPECKSYDFHTRADIETQYLAGNDLGKYQMVLTAKTLNGEKTITDAFEVQNAPDFDVEREQVTRIYPPLTYPVNLVITAKNDFSGTITETVPDSFVITQTDEEDVLKYSTVYTDGNTKTINWNANLKKGDAVRVGYKYKAPLTNPEFYLLGPLKIGTFVEYRSWQIAVDAPSNINFMETPDALNSTTGNTNTQFWSGTQGTVAYDTGTKHSGNGSWKFTGAATAGQLVKDNIMADAGRRATFYMNFASLPSNNTTYHIMAVSNATNGVFILNLKNTSGITNLHLCSGTSGGNCTTPIKTGTAIISAGTWYRISFAYVLITNTNYSFNAWINGGSDITATGSDGTLVGTGTAQFTARSGTSAGQDIYFQDIYVDDDSGLTDAGDIRVTAKLPTSVNADNWDPGSGAINERPPNTANFRTETGTTALAQNYNIQAANAGDIDISTYTLVGYSGWVYAADGSGANGTPQMTLNGNDSAVSLTTTPTIFTSTVLSSTYPSNAAAIGMVSTGAGADTILYEAGIMAAATPPVPTKVVVTKSNGNAMTAGSCNNGGNYTYTVQLQDAGSNPINPTQTTVISLVTNSGGTFTAYSTADGSSCSNAYASNQISFNTSTNTITVYISDTRKSATNWVITGDDVSGDSLTSDTENYTLNAGSITKLVVTLPGQTFTDGSGNSGTVDLNGGAAGTAGTAGVSFDITKLSVTDEYFNVNATDTTFDNDTRTIAYSGASNAPDTTTPSYTTNVQFTNGQSTTTLTTTLYKAETVSGGITATYIGSYGNASSALTINAGEISANTSDSTVAASSATAIISEEVTITITLKDTWRNPKASIAAANITIGATATANITQPSSATNASGFTTGSINWTTAGSKTVDVTISNVSLVQNDGSTADADGKLDDTETVTVSAPAAHSSFSSGAKIKSGTRIRSN